MLPHPPSSTLFPYTTLFRSGRLEEGLEHQLDFVLAKASIALQGSGIPSADIVRTVGRYGLRYRGGGWGMGMTILDRKSTRLNSSHVEISYAVFCLKKKKIKQ